MLRVSDELALAPRNVFGEELTLTFVLVEVEPVDVVARLIFYEVLSNTLWACLKSKEPELQSASFVLGDQERVRTQDKSWFYQQLGPPIHNSQCRCTHGRYTSRRVLHSCNHSSSIGYCL